MVKCGNLSMDVTPNISIIEKIRKALDEGKFPFFGVSLDFQKAIDTVNHKLLISKLEHYGIRGLPLHVFKIIWENEPNNLFK